MAGMAKRDDKKEARWRRRVEAQARSGMSVRAYCAARGIDENGFYWWRRELLRRDACPAEARPAFVPVRVRAEGSMAGGQVEIILPAGRAGVGGVGERRVRVLGPVDKGVLADVLAVLTAGEAVAC